MIRSWMVVGFLGCLPAAACSRSETRPTLAVSRSTPDASTPASLLECVLAIAVRMRQAGLAPEAAAQLCDGSVSATEVATSWEVRTPFSDLSIIGNQTARPTEPALEYSMTIGLAAQVQLRALVATLGPYRIVSESKASTVAFAAPGATARVFAELLSSKVGPDAPVVRMIIRAPDARP